MAAAEVINIVSRSGAKAKFDPPDLLVQQGDVVSWNNKTGRTHELELVNPDGTTAPLPIGGPIARHDQSDALTITQSIQYRCTRHAGETGSITVA